MALCGLHLLLKNLRTITTCRLDLLLDQCPHLCPGLKTGDTGHGNWVGDGIVPVASALAQDEQGDVLSAPLLKRVMLKDISHLALLDDERVYQELRTWLGIDKLLITH